MKLFLFHVFLFTSLFAHSQVIDTIKIINFAGAIKYAMQVDTAGSSQNDLIFTRKGAGGLGLISASTMKLNRYGNSNLSNSPLKYYDTIITNPSTASGFSISIGHIGFTSSPTVMVMALRSTTDATTAPQASLKSVSTSAIAINITQGNSSTVNVLGSLVLLGAATLFATTLSGVSIHVMAIGF